MADERISVKQPYPSKYVDILGSKLHYIEAGVGKPILFLHGIPTSSYVWRNVMPHLAGLGRCIAVDLIGFGHSDKPDIEYTIFDHIKYIEEFIKTLGLKEIILVMHGWGSVIGFDYAMRNEKNCRGLVFYEAFLHSLKDEEVSLPYQEQLLALQGQDINPEMSISGISYIDRIIPQTVMRELTVEEMENYRFPFKDDRRGKQILQYLKELSTNDSKNTVDTLITNYSKKLAKSFLPKLMLYTVPGFITSIGTVMWAKENLPNLEIVEIGEELHLAQESYPELMGETISVWVQGVEQAHA